MALKRISFLEASSVMKRKYFTVAVAAFALSTAACAAELECGLGVDGSVGAYKVVKAGGLDDGVAVGKSLCYM
jgi:hypothetical protein